MVTTNQKRFETAFNEGMNLYKQSIEKSGKSKRRLIDESLDAFSKALELANITTTETRRVPYIYEYITLCYGVIALDYLDEQHDLKKGMEYIGKARETNSKTLLNEETNIRELFFFERLQKIGLDAQQMDTVDSISQQMFDYTQRLDNTEKRILYLNKAKTGFIYTKNAKMVDKVYDTLLKITKKLKKQDEKTKADIFREYGNYCNTILKKPKEATKYLSEAKKLYETLKLADETTATQLELEKVKTN